LLATYAVVYGCGADPTTESTITSTLHVDPAEFVHRAALSGVVGAVSTKEVMHPMTRRRARSSQSPPPVARSRARQLQTAKASVHRYRRGGRSE
jgi:hypothetical protein